jgi:hypothetical protein
MDSGTQAIGRVVGPFDGLSFSLELVDYEDGTKDLLGLDARVFLKCCQITQRGFGPGRTDCLAHW